MVSFYLSDYFLWTIIQILSIRIEFEKQFKYIHVTKARADRERESEGERDGGRESYAVNRIPSIHL